MSEDKKELRKYVDTWISILTVIFAVELASVVFLYQSSKFGVEENKLISFWAFLTIITTILSFASFMVVRDPRTRLDIFKGIDIGVGLLILSVGIAVTGLYLNHLIFVKEGLELNTGLYVAELGLGILFYLLYRKYLSRNDPQW